ncbi:MAG: SEC-C domain-containing protein [Candidatus Magnetobacterium sp. LHC-1]
MKTIKVDLCPCGSGKKYKNCCYKPNDDNKIIKFQPKIQSPVGPKRVLESILKKTEKSEGNNKIISIDDKRFTKDMEKDINSLLSDDKNEQQRAHAIYTEIQHRFSYFWDAVIDFSEFDDWYHIVKASEAKYMPDYPPLSPVTVSHFYCWIYVDLRFGKEQVTLGEVYREVFKKYGDDEHRLELIDNFNKSSMRIYEITNLTMSH